MAEGGDLANREAVLQDMRLSKPAEMEIATSAVRRAYELDSATNSDSFIDHIRFNGAVAYITDAGSSGLIVLDLATGSARRVLDGDRSVTAQRPLTAEGQEMHGPDGKPVFIRADQIEVSTRLSSLHRPSF